MTAARSKRSSRFAARAALVTLPLGVLQAPSGETHALTFRPDPPSFRKALDLLAMGSARRVVFRFRELPWMEVPRLRSEKAIDRLSFLRIESGPFRVWWTTYPAEWPLAVAWCGGPPASLARGDPEEVADLALRGLARDLGVSRRRLASRVEAFWTHDWDADPCARGAYSYARVNGVNAPNLLAKPVQRTLFTRARRPGEPAARSKARSRAVGARPARSTARSAANDSSRPARAPPRMTRPARCAAAAQGGGSAHDNGFTPGRSTTSVPSSTRSTTAPGSAIAFET